MKSTHTLTAHVPIRFIPVGMQDFETAYPTIEITFTYIPGRRAYTPPGEYAPVDPPEPPEVEFISAHLINRDGLTINGSAPSQNQVDEWAADWINTNPGYDAACFTAEEERD